MLTAFLFLTSASVATEEPHRLFVPLTELESRFWYAEGREAFRAKKKLADVLAPWRMTIGKVRAPRGQSWTASFAIVESDREQLKVKGFLDERDYRPITTFDEWLASSEGRARAETARGPQVIVNLFAWPGVNDINGSIVRNANPLDVKGVKFAILPDGEASLAILPFEEPIELASSAASGSVAVPQTGSASGTSTTNGKATITKGSGSQTDVRFRTETQSTVTFNSYEVEGFMAYNAVYRVKFPLYAKDGTPLVRKNAKKLVLKVIRQSETQSVEFDLESLLH